jgi:glycosyltransferase involved in cell wall biosynthesis
MHILQIAPPWFQVPPTNYGGTEWVVSLLTEQLIRRGHQVTLVAAAGSRTSATLRTILPETPSLADRHREYARLVHTLGAYRLRKDFDVVHDHTGELGLALSGIGDGPPVVHTAHGPFDQGFPALLYPMIESTAIVTVSHAQAAVAPPGVRIAGVVHNAVPLAQLTYRNTRRSRNGYLAYVGRANANKAPEVAVDVARRLGMPIRMMVKVNEPPERKYWAENVEPLLEGTRAEVRFSGTQSEKSALFAQAAVTLFPIRWNEPFGLVPLESMACGTPVVAFRRGAVPETIVHGKTGFIVDPDSLDAMCDASLEAVRLSPADCRRHVEQTFSAERMTDGYLSIYADTTAPDRLSRTTVGTRQAFS